MTTTSPLALVRAHTRLLALLVAALGLALVLTACSDDDSGSSDGQPSAPAGSDPNATCGVHKVGDVQVRTFCGEGTASAKGGKVDLTIDNASCETSKDYLSVNAGTIVLGADDAAQKVKATTQYIGLNVGRVPGDTKSKPATKDGTYTGGILTVNDKGTALLANAQKLEVKLTDGRTKGTFTAPLVSGGTVTGSFSCV